MRAVVQRCRQAAVCVDGASVGRIGTGLAVLLGISTDDTEADVQYIKEKLIGLRIFDDENGVPNRSVRDVNGSILLVSQFTLMGDARKGKRPSYIRAARPETAIPLYERCIALLRAEVPVETGVFGADMQVELINDGPFTILLDSKKEF